MATTPHTPGAAGGPADPEPAPVRRGAIGTESISADPGIESISIEPPGGAGSADEIMIIRREEPLPDRAKPPIRWPHPTRGSIAIVGLWLVGLLVALAVPALIVPPGARTAPGDEVALAFGCTVLGAAIMLGAALWLWRRTRETGAFVLGGIPAIACVAGGAILAMTKLYGGVA